MKQLEKLNLRSFLNHKVIHLSASKLLVGIWMVLVVMLFSSCEEQAPNPQDQAQSILPERFKIDIPESLSNSDSRKNGSFKNAENDTLQGNEIYEFLRVFIAIAEGASDITEAIIFSIAAHDIQNVKELNYVSDEDGRIKHLKVNSGVSYDGRDWEYQLTISDLESEGNADGGIGMQVFWNTAPVEGIAILKPLNINFNDGEDNGEALFSVEYSEKAMGDYEAHMIVKITDLPVENAEDAQFACDAIQLFVGKKGDVVDVYGNSNHPNAKFFTDESGFNWAFVASGLQNKDIAVAEVALPPSTLNSTSREVILKEYSLKNVFTNQINIWFVENYGFKPDSTDLAGLLKNADAPGYFNNERFIQGGTAPSDEYGEIENRLNALTPYNPKDISELIIEFLK